MNCGVCGAPTDDEGSYMDPLDEELKSCARIDCGFTWVRTAEYMDCPMCELKELRSAKKDGDAA